MAQPGLASLPDEVLEVVLSHLRISDLLLATHACRAWRSVSDAGASLIPSVRVGITATCQVIDANAYRHWRLAMFRRYYEGRTFRARLPEAWADRDHRLADSQSDPWPPPEECGMPGGPAMIAGDVGARRGTWHYFLAAPGNWPDDQGREAAAKLPPGDIPASGSRLLTNHKDFVHTDVASFFDGQSGDGDTELPSVAQQGWKAFVVHLYFRYDPEGMLDLYTDHALLLPGNFICSRQHFKAIESAAGLLANGWRPTSSALPYIRLNQDVALLLPPNIDFAPGFVVMHHKRKFRPRNPRPFETRIKWRAYLGQDGARATLARLINYDGDTRENGADYEDSDDGDSDEDSDEDASDDGIVTDAHLAFWPRFLRFAFLCHGGSVSIPEFDSPFFYYWSSLSSPVHVHNV
ncbi:hypothetical protein HK405_007288, partial [Cladochytrium tenue]